MAARIISWLRSFQLTNRLYLLTLLISVLVLRIVGRIISWLRSLQLTDRLYNLALLIVIVGLAIARISGDPSDYVFVAAPLAVIVFAVGFGFWIWPWISRIWQYSPGKFILTTLSAGIWILALIQTRILAAEVLGLPPQDFEVTVRVWTFLFFLSSWISIVAVLAMVFSLGSILVAVPLSWITSSIVANIFLKDRWKLTLEKLTFRSFGHAMGAFAFGGLIAIGLSQFSTVGRSFEPLIRLTAYYADYQTIPRYPGIDVTRKSRLHTNGVVSYAEKHGWDVIISVEKIRPIPSVEQSGPFMDQPSSK
jgi:hypothetical protein